MIPLACFLGFHRWQRIELEGVIRVCLKCDKKEYCHNHSKGCVCSICGKRLNPYYFDLFDEEHQWQGCICSRCGRSRLVYKPGHTWDGCKCLQCGGRKAANQPEHTWDVCKCTQCGATKPPSDQSHHYVGIKSVCSHCGTKLPEPKYRWEERGVALYDWEGNKIEGEERGYPSDGSYRELYE